MNFVKFVRIFLLILIVIGIGLLVTQKMWVPRLVDFILQPQQETAQNLPLVSQQASSIKGCYVASLGKDVYTLAINSQDGESVEGSLNSKYFAMDSVSGTFDGTFKNDMLIANYSFNFKGKNSVVQVLFKKDGNDFVRGYGQMDNATGTHFTDLNNIIYDNYGGRFKFSPDCIPVARTNEQGTLFDNRSGTTYTYIRTVDWPPKLEIKNNPFTCISAGKETDTAGQTVKKIINGNNYCVTKVSEGAAGSTYTQYTYTTEVETEKKVFSYTFSLRFVSCDNYDNPQKNACEKERTVFDIDSFMDGSIQDSMGD